MRQVAPVTEQFADADSRARRSAQDMRHPWDDGVFAALARHHGLERTRLTAKVDARSHGWLWVRDDDDTNAHYQLEGVPAAMPSFSFDNGEPASLSINLSDTISYFREGGSRRIILHRASLPDVVLCRLHGMAGQPVSAVVDAPGLDAVRLARVVERDDRYLDLVVDFADDPLSPQHRARDERDA